MKHVRLPETNTGDLLAEVTRAYMHGAMPSAMLLRLIQGLEAFLNETTGPEVDREFVQSFTRDLKSMRHEWRARETYAYREGGA